MAVTKALFKQQLTDLISGYIANYIGNDENPQIRVVPADLTADIVSGSDFLNEIAESEEVIEIAAAADDAESEEASDYQASRIPDFYELRDYVKETGGRKTVDVAAVDALVAKYFG